MCIYIHKSSSGARIPYLKAVNEENQEKGLRIPILIKSIQLAIQVLVCVASV